MSRSVCGVADCVEPKDSDFGEGFCSSHSQEWRRSAEFREAMRDDAVVFAAGLRVPSLLRTALRPHKRRWVKRITADAPES